MMIEKGKKPVRFDAIAELVGGNIAELIEGEISYLKGQTPPSDSEIDTKLTSMIAEYDAQEYARNREVEYPSIQELVVALYDESDKSAIETKRAAVKLKYPKP